MTDRNIAFRCSLFLIPVPPLPPGDACPGFEYHVWKKQCRHCGCGHEAHSDKVLPEGPEVSTTAEGLGYIPQRQQNSAVLPICRQLRSFDILRADGHQASQQFPIPLPTKR